MENSIKKTDAINCLSALFDDGIFTQIDEFAKSADGNVEVAAGYGTVGGVPSYAFAQDISVNDGAIGTSQCSKILKIYDLATKTGCPVIGVYNSNGVKLTEGFEAMSAYGEIVKASTAVSGVVPQISIINGACLGASALMANMADVVIAVKDSDFYISAPSDAVIEDAYRAGIVDILADDFDAAAVQAKRIVSLLPNNNLTPVPVFDFDEPQALCAEGMDAKSVVDAIADSASVTELKAGYGTNLVTALGTVAGRTVGFVAFDGDFVCPMCAYKAEAMIKLCDAYNIPVVTVANAKGISKDKEQQMLIAATKLTSSYAAATCPKISLVTGQAIGSAYIILAGKGANADLAFAWDSAVVSPLDVEASVAFLYNDRLAGGEDRKALEAEYKETIGSPFTAAACGAVNDVFAPQETRAKIIGALDMLSGKRESTIARKHSVK